MIAYRATLDVPGELAWFAAKLLLAERRRSTPRGSRALSCFWQAVLGLRWFRDRTAAESLACDHGISRATAYRYLDEVIAVLAQQAPDLRRALERAKDVLRAVDRRFRQRVHPVGGRHHRHERHHIRGRRLPADRHQVRHEQLRPHLQQRRVRILHGDYTLKQEIDVVTANPVIVRVFIAHRTLYLTLPQGKHVVNTPFHFISGTSNQQVGLGFTNLFSGETVKFCTFRIYNGRIEQDTPYTVAIGTGPSTGGGPWRTGDQVINAAGAGVAGITGWFCTATKPGHLGIKARGAGQSVPARGSPVRTRQAGPLHRLIVHARGDGRHQHDGVLHGARVPRCCHHIVWGGWGLPDHTSAALYGDQIEVTGATILPCFTVEQVITGLSAETVYQMD